MVEVVSPVQNDGVVFIAEEHSGAIALGSVGVRVARVGELVVDGGLVEEGEACGLDLVEELDGDFVFLFLFFFKFLGLCSWIWVCVLIVLVQNILRSQFI